jgi:hypothetical protein
MTAGGTPALQGLMPKRSFAPPDSRGPAVPTWFVGHPSLYFETKFSNECSQRLA